MALHWRNGQPAFFPLWAVGLCACQLPHQSGIFININDAYTQGANIWSRCGVPEGEKITLRPPFIISQEQGFIAIYEGMGENSRRLCFHGNNMCEQLWIQSLSIWSVKYFLLWLKVVLVVICLQYTAYFSFRLVCDYKRPRRLGDLSSWDLYIRNYINVLSFSRFLVTKIHTLHATQDNILQYNKISYQKEKQDVSSDSYGCEVNTAVSSGDNGGPVWSATKYPSPAHEQF